MCQVLCISLKLGELKPIEQQYRDDVTRCKEELFERYKDRTAPSWEGVANALEKLHKITLAERLRSKYVYSPPQQNRDVVALPPTTSSGVTISPTQCASPIMADKSLMRNFSCYKRQFNSLVADIKESIRKSRDISLSHLQDFLQEFCSELQPLQSATMEAVLERMSNCYSLLEHELLHDIAYTYFEHTPLHEKFDTFVKEFEKFQNSIPLQDLISRIKEKSISSFRRIEIKFNGTWRTVTLKQFGEFVAALDRGCRVFDLVVTDGCLCINLTCSKFILHPSVTNHTLKLVGVIHIKVDGKVIYETDQPIDDSASLDAALVSAIMDNDAIAVELLLTIGGNPYTVVPFLGQSVLDVAANMRGNDDCTLLHIACQYGHCDTASMLLKADTDPNLCDACGRTPLQVACAHGNVKIMKLLSIPLIHNPKATKIAKLLREQGTDIDAASATSTTDTGADTGIARSGVVGLAFFCLV